MTSPTFGQRSPFLVAGISARTTNAREMDESTAAIGKLWGRWLGEQPWTGLPQRDEPSATIAVYGDYESDHRGAYTLTIGRLVESAGAVPRGLTLARVPGGDYAVFAGRGAIPDVVVSTWQTVWEYFAPPQERERAYTADFEWYDPSDAQRLEIWIALRPVAKGSVR
ncbi:MAG TPA: GyrI-like domain-containing protein [Gemmatimonadaceae bacterium]|nr:GyrI-like domain-containing protein [Gemmatimonadaceae bacterium]